MNAASESEFERNRTSKNCDSAAEFESHRGRLLGIANRMLGSKADAEDILQEAYPRSHQTDRNRIDTPKTWLVSVITRLSIDCLCSAAVQREAYVGPWLPEPLLGSQLSSMENKSIKNLISPWPLGKHLAESKLALAGGTSFPGFRLPIRQAHVKVTAECRTKLMGEFGPSVA